MQCGEMRVGNFVYRHFRKRDLLRCVALLALFGLSLVINAGLLRSPIQQHRRANPALQHNGAPKVEKVILVKEYVEDEEESEEMVIDTVLCNETFPIWGDKNDSSCSHFETRFGSGLPLHGLFSFPSSGSSWTRYMLEAATGVFTGSEYEADSLFTAGMLGEWVPLQSGWTIVQKSHGFSIGPQRHLYAANMHALGCDYLLLVRHPADAIVSTRHLDGGWQQGFADPSRFRGADWSRYVQLMATSWLDFNMERLHACDRQQLLVIVYEQLAREPLRQLRRMLQLLRYEPDPGRLRCLLKYPEGPLRRNHSGAPAMSDPFSRQQKNMLHGHVRLLNQALLLKGFPLVPHKWTHVQSQHIAD